MPFQQPLAIKLDAIIVHWQFARLFDGLLADEKKRLGKMPGGIVARGERMFLQSAFLS